ncbi:hypothetical protein IM40_03080 [Candidatus Paracaedimonas acanthamoebae]|nr:hypothetical protein IM40_03080 [Candidatus Paracaedimonas acanthamoebae]
MIIKIEGKISASEFHKVVDILSSYFQKHGVEEFIAVDIDLKPFHKEIQLPISLSGETGKEIKSLEIRRSKSGELKLTETTVNSSWMTVPFGSVSPGELMMRLWPLYLVGFGLLILYLMWFKA